MDAKKKAEFVKCMGRKKFARGGLIRPRKYFADGGTTLGGPGSGTVNSASNPNTGVLGTVGGALGLNNNFQAGAANTQAGTNANQLNSAYTGAQNALGQQQNLAGTLAPQAQSAVGEQNQLAGQELAMTQGQGPNPAQAQLNQNTAANVAQTGAQLAGMRGASGNVGLMARNIAQQGAGTQQQAVGQAATLEAQQQIAAQQNLQNLAATQANQAGEAVTGLNTSQQNEQNILQGANTAYNNAQVGMQSNINNADASTAAGNQGVAGKILGGIAGGASGALSSIGLAKGGEVEPHVKVAEMNAASMLHLAKGWGGSFSAPQASQGPNVETMPLTQASGSASDGLEAGISKALTPSGAAPAAVPQTQSDVANWMQNPYTQGTDETPLMTDADKASSMATPSIDSSMDAPAFAGGGSVCEGPHGCHVANFLFAEGGKVPAMVSPGEIYLSPDKVDKVLREGIDPKKIGHRFSGKAKVKGDSYSNDTIPATLERGGVVIDRKHMSTKEKRELFVHRAMARKKAGG